MKKNLKKVISAVIALALSLSSVAFAANASFTDVAETANYYQAVTTLANLGVIAGYEDGTFKPDDNITRAEVTTMVVAAMDMTEQAKGMEGTTKFSDMQSDATKWASGYVNVGVGQKFIAGFEDNTFRPAENVTYAQIITMLVGALNYGEYATYLGGYPNGYLSIAQTSGITKNVSGNAEDTVTRGQVAMLINNFLDTPKVEMGGISYTSDGRLVPTIKIQDGTDDSYYKTVLTENWNIYILEGTVSATSKSDDSSSLKADQVKYKIGKTKVKNNVNGYNDPSSDDINLVGTEIIAYVGDTNAADYLNTYATAYLQYDENDDWVIKNFVPSGKNKTVKFAASLIDDATDGYQFGKAGERDFVRFYATTSASKSTKYTFDNAGATLYVNGKEVGTLNQDYFDKYILNNDAGEVELVDTYASGAAADGYYDIVNVTYYATARVDSVNANSGRITFKQYSNNCASSMTLDDEDTDLEYSITFNGEKIKITDLQEDDILTIAYDSSDKDSFKDSKFYDVTVSRDIVEGKYAGNNKDDRVITLGDKKYEFTELGGSASDSKEDRFLGAISDFSLVLSNEYTAYLDVFGRIFDMEITANSAKIAIADKVVTSSTYDNYGLTLYTLDGVSKTYEVDAKTSGWEGSSDAIKKIYNGTTIDNSNKKDINDRVVEYKINSKGYITSLKLLSGTKADGDFRSNTTAVGAVRMSDATKVIDAIDYVDRDQKVADLKVAAPSNFVDDTRYVVYGYGTKFSDGTYPFVLVTVGEGKYTEDTRMAVLTSSANQTVVDGEELDSLTMFVPGEDNEQTIAISDNAILSKGSSSIEASALSKGDLVIYTLDANNQIKDLDVIFKGDNFITTSGYKTLKDAMLVVGDHKDLLTVPTGTTKWTDEWKPANSSDTPAQIVIGPIVEKANSSFSIGKVATGTFGEYTGPYTSIGKTEGEDGGIYNIGTNGDTAVYKFDYSAPSRTNLTVGAVGDLIKSDFAKSEMLEDQTVIPWNNIDGNMNVAIAKVVNGVATEVFVLTNEG